jgi:bacillithiol biosynthesis deacetylase BshB1
MSDIKLSKSYWVSGEEIMRLSVFLPRIPRVKCIFGFLILLKGNMKMDFHDQYDVVAVAAHPDDLEITCGGTLALMVQQGYKVAIVDLTTGEPTPRGSEAIRASEAENARIALGVHKRILLGLPNRVLMDSPENRFKLATLLRKLKPEILIGTSGRTPAASPDHYQAQLLIEASRFYAQFTKWDDKFENTKPHRITHLVYAPFPFDAEVREYPGSFTVDVSSTWEKKMASIRCYESQFDAARFDRIRHTFTGFNVAMGSKCGFAYGETFHLPVPVGTTDLVSLVRGSKGTPAPVSLAGHAQV